MIPIRYNLRSLLERRATSLMTVLGLGMVAMIFVILFGFIGGLKEHHAERERRAQLGAARARARRTKPPASSAMPRSRSCSVRPEIAFDDDGQPLISKEVFAGVNISRDKHVRQFVQMRGVTPIALRVHRNMHLVSGHWPIAATANGPSARRCRRGSPI